MKKRRGDKEGEKGIGDVRKGQEDLWESLAWTVIEDEIALKDGVYFSVVKTVFDT